ncbi:hypothetical protein BU25DRAFT_407808 [Macroventuria anomochaeta]|uniref:Uncharacterized protein n=1 Tax=Macroventuria anomochaeta TaxID=301207 RepID=A0ACB6SAI9_9PLEO|nr:uncharacterized protein BU25DRAFT_407808 [Macroventuria anomochaeta]KAF2631295.1 hypothetical protein BU25DRAFT_407808 [Macroventuria anomochaeta]
MDHTRAVRPPPGARRNLFHPTRRQNPTAVRPDTATVFQQPMEDELVERAPNGEYALYAPQTVYKHMALGLGNGRESDEETEQENQMIELYGQQNAHWDKEAVKAEVKTALKSSLAKKVARLEDDKWMFEGDGDALGKK